MSLEAFTRLHVVISLIGIATGLAALYGLISGNVWKRCTAVFLATTVLTSVTGFLFPFNGVTPAHVLGAISLVLLPLAVLALYRFELRGPWRRTYVICATMALYLNSFVAVVQAFLKIPFLREMAPTQTEPPFGLAQAVVLGLFIWWGVRAARNLRGPGLTARA